LPASWYFTPVEAPHRGPIHVDGDRAADYPDHMPDQIDPGVSGAWQIQEAKARFSELLRASVEDGPQTVTRRGVPLAVLVSAAQWNALSRAGAPTLKDLLLAPNARATQLVPPRKHLRRRAAARLR
jgi:antitoxin Phd